MRVVLAIALLFQLLVAQTGLAGPGTGHEDGLTGHIDTQAQTTHSHADEGAPETVQASGESADEGNGSHPHERCCCAFMGHCSSSAVATQTHDDMPFSPAAHRTALAGAFAARGFGIPPYRPPLSFL